MSLRSKMNVIWKVRRNSNLLRLSSILGVIEHTYIKLPIVLILTNTCSTIVDGGKQRTNLWCIKKIIVFGIQTILNMTHFSLRLPIWKRLHVCISYFHSIYCTYFMTYTHKFLFRRMKFYFISYISAATKRARFFRPELSTISPGKWRIVGRNWWGNNFSPFNLFPKAFLFTEWISMHHKSVLFSW